MPTRKSPTRIASSEKTHIHSAFDDELKKIYQTIEKMGVLAIDQLDLSMDIALNKKTSLIKKVNLSDRRLGKLERDIDRISTRTLALRQPMAVDLRRIVSAMKISSDIERCGDYSKNIARRSKSLADGPVPHATMLSYLSGMVREMWEKVMEAYSTSSTHIALTVFNMDDAVDDHYTGLFREMLNHMMDDPRQISSCINVLFMAKNLERIGDLATNVSEEIYYQETGKIIK